MSDQIPTAAAAGAGIPRETTDPIADISAAADWSRDYYNRRAFGQLLALAALGAQLGALVG